MHPLLLRLQNKVFNNIESKITGPSKQHRKAASVQNFNSLKLFMMFDCPQLHYDAQKFEFFYLTQSKTPSFFKNSRYVS